MPRTARIEGNNAKSNESLTLIARGSGGSFERGLEDVGSGGRGPHLPVRPGLRARSGSRTSTVHTQIRTLDDGGQWDKAVALATTTSNATFTTFDTNVARVVDSASAETTGGLAATVPWMIIGAILSLIAGIAMAVLGRRGLAQRLKEYR